jgi:hypothetical protein
MSKKYDPRDGKRKLISTSMLAQATRGSGLVMGVSGMKAMEEEEEGAMAVGAVDMEEVMIVVRKLFYCLSQTKSDGVCA